ncbi:MAG TPA: DUF2116 family Zn-ribbon domain-containing protein [Gemmataceae bacterium]|nr:DUF2116 family Zn-ribbon domain-containing protein [Gemmataceae bacterium]
MASADDDDDFLDHEQDEDEPTIPCPYCRRPIHEDSVRCPHCERYISEEDRRPARKAWWIVLGVLLALYAVYRWVAG